MLESLANRLTLLSRRYVPDPFVLALLLTLLTLAAALAYVHFDVSAVLDAWMDGTGGGRGFWNLLGFGMQMCLILVTGHALAESPPVARLLDALADRARTPRRAVLTVALSSMLLGYVSWGLGLIAGALLARRVGLRARERGVAVHYPLLVAAGYTGMLVWHGGLSGSAPLKVTTTADLVQILGPAAASMHAISLSQTIGSIANLVVAAGLLVLVPWVLLRMQPADPAARAAAPHPGTAGELNGAGASTEAQAATTTLDRPSMLMSATGAVPLARAAEPPATPAERLERSTLLVLAVAVPAVGAWLLATRRQGLARLDLNLINFLFLFAGLVLHRSARSYAAAVSEAARGSAGIILQFPFYAGIMGLLAGTGLLEAAAAVVARAGATLLPAVAFYMAGIVNLFVPSGGGQWAVQGPLLIEAAHQLGVEPAKMVMALAYGDEWTNMLQPFWALPLLAITGARARDIVGYTAVLLVVSQAVFLLGLYLPW